MKKFYSTLALSMAVVASASAFETVQMKKTATLVGEPVKTVQVKDAASKVAKAGPARIASAEEIEGVYVGEYDPALNNSQTGEPVYDAVDAIIEAADVDLVLITMNPWATKYSNVEMDPLLATVDLSASKITIAAEDNQGIGKYTPNGTTVDYEISLVLMEMNLDQQQWVDAESVTGTINADGTIEFPETTTIYIGVDMDGERGWLGGMTGLKLVYPDYFTFKESEWNYVGESTFTEGIVNGIMDEGYEIAPVKVDMYQNKANAGLYAAKNPYSTGDWALVNEDPTVGGYIVFNIENPDFVCMRPLTGSGLWMTVTQDGFPQEIYFHNIEGMWVFNEGMTVAEAAKEFAERKLTPSKYNAANRTVNLENIYFGTTENPFNTLMWNAVENATYKFTIPDGTGVDGIYTDSENVAKRYFNLQGVEIANPEAGQVVIVKEGNKTSKTIVR
jgi:hypothetical protein